MDLKLNQKIYLLIRCLKNYAILNQSYELAGELGNLLKALIDDLSADEFEAIKDSRSDYFRKVDNVYEYLINNDLVNEYFVLYSNPTFGFSNLFLQCKEFLLINKKLIHFTRDIKINRILQ
jgi:hypothetical protein